MHCRIRLGRLCFPDACCEGQVHDDLPLARESQNHHRRIKNDAVKATGDWVVVPFRVHKDDRDGA